MAREVLSRSEEETRSAARSLRLAAGEVVLLVGDLGAGKTTFVKGIAEACGVEATVRSPTFALMHRYRGDPDVVHLDLYRESEAVGLEDLDLDADRDSVVIAVEWPRGLADMHWPDALRVTIEHVDETTRLIKLPR
ncbi:MAG: tRNA (adenosine(37)-N6)-threonylcarbamoyltransferase complex ATPase subunit type 1 TsaE [Planctomycetota bacterium]|jgi:tRNA threonylcarbamoyladenosine biosynthesis protein TsaE